MKKTFFSLSLLSFLLVASSVSAYMPRKETQLLSAVVGLCYGAEKINALCYVPEQALEPVKELCTFLGLKNPNALLRFARTTASAAIVAPAGANFDPNEYFSFSDQRKQVCHNAVATLGALLALKKADFAAVKNIDPVDGSTWAALLTAGHYKLPGVAETGVTVATNSRNLADGVLNRVTNVLNAIKPVTITNTTSVNPVAPAVPANDNNFYD